MQASWYTDSRTQDGEYNNQKLNHMAKGEPFPVKITVRSEQHERLILEESSRAGSM
jgi:hypothetical protein